MIWTWLLRRNVWMIDWMTAVKFGWGSFVPIMLTIDFFCTTEIIFQYLTEISKQRMILQMVLSSSGSTFYSRVHNIPTLTLVSFHRMWQCLEQHCPFSICIQKTTHRDNQWQYLFDFLSPLKTHSDNTLPIPIATADTSHESCAGMNSLLLNRVNERHGICKRHQRYASLNCTYILSVCAFGLDWGLSAVRVSFQE